jgi:hypothetical protein
MTHESTKQCAKIAVNEIEIAERNALLKFNIVTNSYKSEFWEEVLNEIDKL